MRDIEIGNCYMALAFHFESEDHVSEAQDARNLSLIAEHMHYLVQHEHVDAPTISPVEISDKSTAGSLAKVIAAAQSAWFVLQLVARAVEVLAISLLELATLCLMKCTGVALFFWFHKPFNIRSPFVASQIFWLAPERLRRILIETRPSNFASRSHTRPQSFH